MMASTRLTLEEPVTGTLQPPVTLAAREGVGCGEWQGVFGREQGGHEQEALQRGKPPVTRSWVAESGCVSTFNIRRGKKRVDRGMDFDIRRDIIVHSHLSGFRKQFSPGDEHATGYFPGHS